MTAPPEHVLRFAHVAVGIDLDPDGSEPTAGSRKALEQAIWIARHSGADVLLLHSTYDDEAALSEAGGLPSRELSPEGRTALDQLTADLVEQGIPARLEVVPDRAWFELARRAARGEVDLIVVARSSEDEDGKTRIGGIGTKLLREAPSAVWVVKPGHDLVHRLVLAATDLTPVGSAVVRTAAEVAIAAGAELHVVHARRPREGSEGGEVVDEEALAERSERVRAEVAASVRDALGDLVGRIEPVIQLGRGKPATVIREAVVHLDPDLLVMGMLSRAGVAGLHVGSTTERVLDHVDGSLLALKPEDFVSPVEAG